MYTNFKNLSALTARYFLRLSPCLDFHSGLYDFSCTFNITWKQRETKVHVIKVFIWLPISQKYYHFMLIYKHTRQYFINDNLEQNSKYDMQHSIFNNVRGIWICPHCIKCFRIYCLTYACEVFIKTKREIK